MKTVSFSQLTAILHSFAYVIPRYSFKFSIMHIISTREAQNCTIGKVNGWKKISTIMTTFNPYELITELQQQYKNVCCITFISFNFFRTQNISNKREAFIEFRSIIKKKLVRSSKNSYFQNLRAIFWNLALVLLWQYWASVSITHRGDLSLHWITANVLTAHETKLFFMSNDTNWNLHVNLWLYIFSKLCFHSIVLK